MNDKVIYTTFLKEWDYFCCRINWGDSTIDARAVSFMNTFESRLVEMLDKVHKQEQDERQKLRAENASWKARWVDMLRRISTNTHRAMYREHLIFIMNKLESGGESPRAVRGTKSGVLENPRLLSQPDKVIGTPKPDKIEDLIEEDRRRKYRAYGKIKDGEEV